MLRPRRFGTAWSLPKVLSGWATERERFTSAIARALVCGAICARPADHAIDFVLDDHTPPLPAARHVPATVHSPLLLSHLIACLH